METPSADARSAAFDVDNSVSVIDASRCSARSTSGCRPRAPEGAIPGVPHAGRPAAVTADPAVATVYVAGPTGVTMIDARRCNAWSSSGCAAPPPTVPTGARPSAVEVDPGTHTGYVADPGSGDSGTISVFEDRTCNATDQAGCARLSTLPVPGGIPVAMAINSQTHTLYVATVTHTGGPDLISVFDAATCNANSRAGCDRTPANVLIANGSSFGAAMDLAVNRATNTIYATNVTLGTPFAGDTVYVIDGAGCDAADTSRCGVTPATIALGSTIFGDANPFGFAVDEDTNTVYTANIADGEGPGTVSVINGATCNGRDTSGCSQSPATAPAGFGTSKQHHRRPDDPQDPHNQHRWSSPGFVDT